MNSRGVFLATFLAAFAIITYHEVVNLKRFPFPGGYGKLIIVWVVLSLIEDITNDSGIGAVFAVGLVMAMAYTFFTSSKPLLGDPATQASPVIENPSVPQ